MKKVSIKIQFVLGLAVMIGSLFSLQADSGIRCTPPENSIIGSNAACPGGLDSFMVATDNTDQYEVDWYLEGGTFVGPSENVAKVFVQWNDAVGDGRIWFTETCEDITRNQDTIDVDINYDLDRITLTCYTDINIGFGPNCVHYLHPTELVSSGEIKCADDFTLEILSGGAAVPNPIPYSYIDDRLTVTITHKDTGKSCWSYVTLNDNVGPTITAYNDTIVCTNPVLHDPYDKTLKQATSVDNCGRIYTPRLVDFSRIDDPSGTYKEIIVRKWEAKDKFDNPSYGYDSIFVIDIDIEEIICPADTILPCDGKFDINNPSTSGTPTFEGYSVYGDDPYCKIYIVYEDEIENSCGKSQSIVRKWTIRSFEEDTKSERICYQNITIVDNVGPEVKGYDQTFKRQRHPDLTDLVSTKSYPTFYYGITGDDCLGEGTLPRPRLNDFCSPNDSIYVKVKLTNNTRSYYNYESNPNLEFVSLGVGKYIGVYHFRDLCNGVSTDTVVFVLNDVEKPYPVVDKDANVSLPNSSYITWVDVSNFDEGSWDNCGIKAILGRRVDWKTSFGVDICDGMTKDPSVNEVEAHYNKVYNDLYWSEDDACRDTLIAGWEEDLACKIGSARTIGGGWSTDIPFGCDDACAGQPVPIELIIFDYYGNLTLVWTTVEVEDKSPAQVVNKLDDINLSCRAYNKYYKDKVQKGDYSVFGKYVFQDEERDSFLLRNLICSDKIGFENSYYQYVEEVRRDGLIRDNCKPNLKEEVSAYFDDCGEGWIERRFTFESSCSSNKLDPIIYTQKIYISKSCALREVDIKWPEDHKIIYGCPGDEIPVEVPEIIFDDACYNFVYTHKDVDINVGQVDTVYRKIKRTWSVRDWCDALNTEIIYDQIIILRNGSPTIKLSEPVADVCVEDDCSYDFIRSVTVSDQCSGAGGVTTEWKVYDNTNLNPTLVASGKNKNIQALGLDKGAYILEVYATDTENATSTEKYYFLVKDCAGPQINLKNDPYVNLIADGNRVTGSLSSDNVDNGSVDNCGIEATNSRLSFMSDLYYRFDGSIDTIENISSQVTCDCFDMGKKMVYYWVSDASGNTTRKEIEVTVKDPNDYCRNIIGEVSGKVRTTFGTAMKNVVLDLYQGNSKLGTTVSGIGGEYTFKNITPSSTAYYRIVPRSEESNYYRGVDLRDLVLMRYHLLGKRYLSTYYERVASDSNGDGVLSLLDLINLKRLMLGKIDHFGSNPLVFVNTDKKGQTVGRFASLKNSSTFTAVKMGDVDDSYLHSNLNRSQNKFFVSVDDSELLPHQTHTVRMEIPFSDQTEGVMMSLAIDDEVASIKEVRLSDLSEEDYRWDEKSLQLIQIGADTDADMVSIEFDIVSKVYTKLSSVLNVINDRSPSMIIVDGQDYTVELDYSDTKISEIKTDVFPNPFDEEMTIHILSNIHSAVSIKIVDVNGKTVITRERDLISGDNTIRLEEVSSLTSGVYMLTIEGEGIHRIQKVIKR